MKLTKRQHYVPRFYLEHWANTNARIVCHDLADDRSFESGPENALVQSFFYEDDPQRPDNRIENRLSEMEARTSAAFRKIADWPAGGTEQRLVSHIEREIGPADIALFSEFAAYQYLRVPGAVALKELELKAATAEGACLIDSDGLKPGLFVEENVARIIKLFRALRMSFLITPGQPFITSDVPCFDFQRSQNLPMLGHELGVDPEATAVLPLSPRVCAMFSHKEFLSPDEVRSGAAYVAKLRTVRNINSMLIERAERYVVSSQEEPFVFKVADKRPRGKPKPHRTT